MATTTPNHRNTPWWERLLKSGAYVCILLLLLSYLSAYISPKSVMIFAYLGLIYPILLFANLISLVFWAFRKRKLFFFVLFAIIIGMIPLSRFIQITFFEQEIATEKSFKIMSFNVRVFDLYNWSGNIASKDKIIAFLDREKPDVICFQEYYHGTGNNFSVRDTLMDLLDMHYVKEHFTTSSSRKNKAGVHYFGSAIFSKYPIMKEGVIVFEGDKNNHAIYVDILKNTDTIRIFNAHIGSLKLNNADYNLIGGDDNKPWPHQKKASQNFLNRMSLAYAKRVDQVTELVKETISSPYPVVICTDMNDVPSSYAYRQFSKNYTDAFVTSGSGIGSTYIGENIFNTILPINRIDYIFYDSNFTSNSFITHQEEMSDHRAISCRLGVK